MGCVFCVCACVTVLQTPPPASPQFKSLKAGSQNHRYHLYLFVLSGCFQSHISHYAFKVFCILQYHAFVSLKKLLYPTWQCNDPCHSQSASEYTVCSFFFSLFFGGGLSWAGNLSCRKQRIMQTDLWSSLTFG